MNIYSDALKRGFIIGNHSFSHPNFVNISQRERKEEIKKCEEQLSEIYAANNISMPKLFRYPGGADVLFMNHVLKTMGYISPFTGRRDWYWHVDLKDGKNIPEKLQKDHIKDHVGDHSKYDHHSVILSHDCAHNFSTGFFQKMYDYMSEIGMHFMTNNEIHELVENLV